MASASAPTKVRLMNSLEYGIVSGVFGATLPSPSRILITNGAGLDGRPFTIPTSLLSLFGWSSIALLPGGLLGYLHSAINVAYLINVGKHYNSLSSTRQELLVHETTHVWQGKNSSFALSYVFSSAINQVLYGGTAYTYVPGSPWKSYNAEQQASIVEDWFVRGKPPSGPLYPYIVNHVRKGDA